MYRADYHLHTTISDDSPAALEEQASAALNAGLNEICVTDHFNLLDQLANPLPHTRDWGASIYHCRRVRETFAGQVDIRLGVEVGNGDLDPDGVNAALAGAGEELDFVIGSLHNMGQGAGGLGIYTAARRARTREEGEAILDDYFDTLDALVATDTFDILGHVIYPLRYLPRKWALNFEPYEDRLRAVFAALIDSGRGIEVNTEQGISIDGWLPVLKVYRDCGGELLTTGSDAHRPQGIAAGFGRVYELIRSCGFRWLCTYRNRRPVMHPLD